jgi:hypothetical protein
MSSPFLPSVQEQLQSRRDESETEFAVTHIDTCLSSFLNDHHNRDGELLLGVFVDGNATVGQVLDGLRDEYRQIAYEMGENRLGFDYDAGLAAIDSVIAENDDNRDKPFDASLDVLGEDDDCSESCQAWFLIHWDVPEEEDGSSD